MLRKYDVAVIGGGIIGLSCGYYLSKQGKSVIVFESNSFGNGASGACDDMILFQSKQPGINLEMAFESLELYKGLSDELDTDLGLKNHGGMVLIETDEELSIMEDFVKKQRNYNLKVDLIDKKAMIKKQPYLSSQFIASTYSDMDSQVDPFSVMLGFFHRGKALGMEVLFRTEIVDIDRDSAGDFILTASNSNVFGAETVVNAAGAWAGNIAAMVGESCPMTPKRGQLLITEKIPAVGETNLWTAKYLVTKLIPDAPVRQTSEERKLGLAFSFTRTKDGNYLIGSTREYAGFEKKTTYEGINSLARQAVEYLPVMNEIHFIRAIAGLRPSTPDGKMLLGESDNTKGFYTAAGHEGDGISLAPITGKVISNMVCGKAYDKRLNELSPGRFVKENMEVAL